MQQGMLASILLSLLLLISSSVSSAEISPSSRDALLQSSALKDKVDELMKYVKSNDVDTLRFTLNQLAFPQQESLRFLLLKRIDEQRSVLTVSMKHFIVEQRTLTPVYYVVQQGDGYEFSLPAFDYPNIANRILKTWIQDKSVLNFILKAEHNQLNLRKWLSGDKKQVHDREDLLIREIDSLTPEAVHSLISQLTGEDVTTWLPSTRVMLTLVEKSQDEKLYKLFWLMRADSNMQKELQRLSTLADKPFALKQIVLASHNPRLKRQALLLLTKLPRLPDDVKSYLVTQMNSHDETYYIAHSLIEHGYRHWLKELLASNVKINRQVVSQVLAD
jgi:hypothetical protein